MPNIGTYLNIMKYNKTGANISMKARSRFSCLRIDGECNTAPLSLRKKTGLDKNRYQALSEFRLLDVVFQTIQRNLIRIDDFLRADLV